jgi:signal transduction histidine kinase/PAS domain-containing protein
MIIFLHLSVALVLSFLTIYFSLTKNYLRARLMVVLLAGSDAYVFGYAMEMLCTDLASKLFWAKFQFVGLGLMLLFPLFLLHYFQDERHVNMESVLALSVVPATMVALAFTNELHGLVFTAAQVNALDLNAPLLLSFGPAFTLFHGYSYLLILAVCVYVVRKVSAQGYTNKLTLASWMGLILLPVIVSFNTYFIQKNSFNYSPIAFGLTFIVLTVFAPEEIRLGKILPVAFASIVSEMDDLVLLVNRQSKVIHVNQSAEATLSSATGISMDNVVGKNICEFIEGSSFDSLGGASDTEVSLGGHSYDVSSFYMSNWRSDPTNLVIILRDITERARGEERIQTLHGYATRMAAAGTLNEVGEVTNNALCDSLQFKIGGIILRDGDALDVLVSWGINDGRLKGIIKMSLTQGGEIRGSKIVCPDPCGDPGCEYGSFLFVPVNARINDSEMYIVLGSESKVFTSREQLLLETFSEHIASAVERINHEEQRRKMQRAEVQRVLEGASMVSSMVRHDLRGPLQTIRNASYLIKRDPANIEQMIPVIDKSVDYMVKVLEELRYSDSADDLVKVELDLNTLVKQSLKQIIVPEKVKVETVFGEPEILYPVDKIRIHRILDNLIRNAIEAMPSGGRLIISTGLTENGVRLTVEDTGVGIQNVDDLFKPFRTTKKNGVGLGLVSCKQSVEAHGGVLSVESAMGKGARFIIDLPSCGAQSGNKATKVKAIIAK